VSIKPYKPKKDVQPYYVCALDIETASTGAVLAIGFAWMQGDTRYYQAFEGWAGWYEFFQQLYKESDKETRERLRYVYAHNGAAFDWLSLIAWAEDNELMSKMKFIVSGGIGIGIDMQIANKFTVKLRDSVRLMPGTLDSLAQSFGTDQQKNKVPGDYISRMEDYKVDYPDEFWSYLQADVLSLQEIVYRFWTLIYAKVGSVERLPMTLPALAMKLWRMTLPHEIMVSSQWRLRELERRAYTGGRTECYAATVADVKVYDANSLYPTVMESQMMPASYRGGWVDDYTGEPGIYEIRFNQTNHDLKPVLRDEESNDFVYKGAGVYCQPEIEMLLNVGAEIDVVQGYVYEDMEPLFQTFIQDWYGTRLAAQKEGNEGLAYVCKILMNSLYGKFGQKEEGETVYFWDEDTIELEMMKIENGDKDAKEFVEFGEYVIVKEQRHSETTFVAIAAYITCHARLNLYRQMRLVQEMGGELYATDTDSVHVSGVILPTGKELGEWKEEFGGKVAYLGKKLYARDDGTVKAKGIGRDAREKLSFEIFSELAKTGESLEAEFTVFPSIKESLSRKRPVNQPFKRKRRIRATAPLQNGVPLATLE
jgi:hypothetical protein